MILKMAHAGVQRESGWHYFVDADGDISRIPDQPADIQPPILDAPRVEKVASTAVRRDPDRICLVDDDGDVISAPLNRIHLLFSTANPLEETHDCTSYFEGEENHYWAVIANSRDTHLSELLGPRRVQTRVTVDAPRQWLPGDRLFLYDSSSRALVAVGELTSIAEEPDAASRQFYNVAWFAAHVERNSVLAAASRGRGASEAMTGANTLVERTRSKTWSDGIFTRETALPGRE